MPIHDQGYRRYAGRRVPAGRAWLVIARAGVRTMLARRPFVALLLLAWLPFLYQAARIYASTALPQVGLIAPNAKMFRDFLSVQAAFSFFVTVYAGAGLIANDRRANALQIYLSKPMTRFEYVFGKCAVLAFLLLFVTWIPALLLLLLQVVFSGSLRFFLDHVFLFPAITLFSWIQVAVATLMMLAMSSLSRSSRYVGMLYAALLFFSRAVSGVVFMVTRDPRMSWISVSSDLDQIGNAIFRLPTTGATPVPVALIVIAIVLIGSGFILRERVRGVEVVV